MTTAFLQTQTLKVSASSLEASVEAFVEELASETNAVRQSEAFLAYLNTMSKFWKYSFHNQVLIYLQNRNASLVAGFKTWNNLGRSIKAGSKAIKILAPFSKKIKKLDLETSEEKELSFTYFVPVSVFDISQTQGKEIVKLDINLEGDNFKHSLNKLLKFCTSKSIQVEFKPLSENFYGYSAGGKIVLNSKQSTNTQVNTLVHEIAHELIHKSIEGKAFSKQEKETQAESIAFVVCKAIGLQTKSPAYLALNQTTSKQIQANLKTIAKTSKEILEQIDASIYLQNSNPIEAIQEITGGEKA